MSNLVILLFAYINIKGIKESAKVQNFIAITLVSLVFVVFTIMFVKVDRSKFLENYVYDYKFNLGEVLRIFAITPPLPLWALTIYLKYVRNMTLELKLPL